jgi:tRNA threonylcarbamoyladenosine biosynthesis protein TsaB
MKALAVDTSTPCCSVAFKDEDRSVAEFSYSSPQTHSKHLMSIIQNVLAVAGVSLSDVDIWIVGLGPGSFTGLRIGISTLQGISMATGRPLIGISGLEALAWQAADPGRLICPLIDARRNEVYFGHYRSANDRLNQEKSAGVAKISSALAGIENGSILIGNGTVTYRAEIETYLDQAHLSALILNHEIRASAMVAMALKNKRLQPSGAVKNLKPIYLRKSDAEIAMAQKTARFGMD